MAILVHHILEQLLKGICSFTSKINLVSLVEILIIFDGRKASHLREERHNALCNTSVSLLISLKNFLHLPTAQLLHFALFPSHDIPLQHSAHFPVFSPPDSVLMTVTISC